MDRGGTDGDIIDVFKITKGTNTGEQGLIHQIQGSQNYNNPQARLQTSLSASGFPSFTHSPAKVQPK